MQNAAVQNTEDYVREIVTIFFVQLKTIILVTLIISLCAVYVAYFWPPTHAVYGTVLLKAKKLEKSPESLEQTQIKHFELTKEDLSSEMEMMTSPDLIRSTILAMSEEGTYYPEMKNSQDQISRTINSLKSQLTTELLPNSNIIKLTFSDRNSGFAKKLLQQHMDQYLNYRRKVYSPIQVTSFFENQTKKFDIDLKEKENELKTLVKETGAADPSQKISNNLLIQKDIEQQLVDLENAVMDKRQSLTHIGKALRSDNLPLFSFIDHYPINQISVRLQDLIIQRDQELGDFGLESTQVPTFFERQTGATNFSRKISNSLLIQKEIEKQLIDLENTAMEKRQTLAHIEKVLLAADLPLFSFIDHYPINQFTVRLQDLIIEREKELREFMPESKRIQSYDQQIINTQESLQSEVQGYANDLSNKLFIDENKIAVLTGKLKSIEAQNVHHLNYRMQSYDQQIAKVHKALQLEVQGYANDLSNKLFIDENKIAALATKLKSIQAQNVHLNDVLIQGNQIKRDVGLLEQSYKIFMQRWEEAKINATSEAGNLFSISILTAPYYSGSPIFPNKTTVIPFGIIAGLLAGISLGFLRNYFDHTVKRPEDIKRFTDLPVLFSIPKWHGY